MRCALLVASLACVSLLACTSSHSDAAPPSDSDAALSDARAEAASDASVSCPPPGGSTTTLDPASTPALAVAGDTASAFGLSDPSLVWPSGGDAGYLSYTSLASTALFTRIARTTDGVTFTYVADANAYADVSVATTDTTVCGSATCTGRLVHETSSLVDDATDPAPARRFKLFDYSYVIVPAASTPPQHAWGYIGLYTAASPEGPWSAGSKAVGWTSTASGVSSDGAATVATSIAELADCAAFTEPAALVDAASGTLYLALGCATQTSARVVLLRSADHAASFTYVGALLSVADGTSLGSTSPGAMPSDFFQDQGATYLIVSTLGTTPTVANAPSGYTSCVTVGVDDLASATVHRDGHGAAVVGRRIVAPGGAFAGACAFKPGFGAGYLVDEVVSAGGAPNRVLASGIGCP